MHLAIWVIQALGTVVLTESLPCDTTVCPRFYQCQVVNGTAKCSCKRNCTSGEALLCGENGVTYINQCALEKAECHLGRSIVALYNGNCSGNASVDGCAAVQCSNGKTCHVVNGSAMCACSKCPRLLEPVCGADNQTYMNDCYLQLASCERGSSVPKVANGSCDDCLSCRRKNKFCEYSLGNGTFYCSTCPDHCPKKGDAVCGSDDQTYENRCLFERTMCREKNSLKIRYNGTCNESANQGGTYVHKSHIFQMAIGISLGVIAVLALVVFAALWFSFRFRIPKKAKRWDKLFRADVE